MLIRACDFCGKLKCNSNTIGERIPISGDYAEKLNVIIKFEKVKLDDKRNEYFLSSNPDICNDCASKFVSVAIEQHEQTTSQQS